MKAMLPERHERMLFALLRASLHEQEPKTAPFRGCPGEEWIRCRRLAAKQGVMALAWDGVTRLPAALQPPLPVKLAWAAAVERQEQRYRYYCRTVDGLSRFYAQHGISVMQLKGTGLSTIYPVPSHREGGDIDIYTYSADKSRMSDAEANSLADELMRRENITVDTDHTPKHSIFYYKGIPVENHKTFLNVESIPAAVQAEKVLRENMHPQLTALDGGQVLTPPPPFNLLFAAFHAAQHYGGSLTLHHLCDWACLLKNYGPWLPEGITDRRFLRFVSALTLLSGQLLGTDVAEADIPEADAPEELAREILEAILHPRYGVVVPAKNKAGILLYKTRRMCYLLAQRRKVLRVSPWRTVLRSVVEHIRKPETIFQRGTEQ